MKETLCHGKDIGLFLPLPLTTRRNDVTLVQKVDLTFKLCTPQFCNYSGQISIFNLKKKKEFCHQRIGPHHFLKSKEHNT